MSNRVIAISTGVSYLDKNKWCVKDLKVGHRRNGTPFWFVSGLGCNFNTEADAQRVAKDIATNMEVPYFLDVVHGQVIKHYQKHILKHLGVIVE